MYFFLPIYLISGYPCWVRLDLRSGSVLLLSCSDLYSALRLTPSSVQAFDQAEFTLTPVARTLGFTHRRVYPLLHLSILRPLQPLPREPIGYSFHMQNIKGHIDLASVSSGVQWEAIGRGKKCTSRRLTGNSIWQATNQISSSQYVDAHK